MNRERRHTEAGGGGGGVCVGGEIGKRETNVKETSASEERRETK